MDKVGRRIAQVIGDVGVMVSGRWSCCSLAIEYRQVGGRALKWAVVVVIFGSGVEFPTQVGVNR